MDAPMGLIQQRTSAQLLCQKRNIVDVISTRFVSKCKQYCHDTKHHKKSIIEKFLHYNVVAYFTAFKLSYAEFKNS